MAEMAVTGLKAVLAAFDKAPKEMRKVCRKALASASRVTARDIRKKIPARWRRLVKSKTKESKGHRMYANAGLYFSAAAVGGHQPKSYTGPADGISDWFKAYWLNYGTLNGRDPSHRFERKVKAGGKRKKRNGVKASRFFDTAVRGWEGDFAGNFKSCLEQQGYSLK
jgi:hypothetical protein